MISLRCSCIEERSLKDIDEKSFFRGLYGILFRRGSLEDYEKGQRVRVFDDWAYRQLIRTQNPVHCV